MCRPCHSRSCGATSFPSRGGGRGSPAGNAGAFGCGGRRGVRALAGSRSPAAKPFLRVGPPFSRCDARHTIPLPSRRHKDFVTVHRGTVPIFAAQRAFLPNSPPFPPRKWDCPFAWSGENCPRHPVNGYKISCLAKMRPALGCSVTASPSARGPARGRLPRTRCSKIIDTQDAVVVQYPFAWSFVGHAVRRSAWRYRQSHDVLTARLLPLGLRIVPGAPSWTGHRLRADRRRLYAQTLPCREGSAGDGRVAGSVAVGRHWRMPGVQRCWAADRAPGRTIGRAFRSPSPEAASVRMPPSDPEDGLRSETDGHDRRSAIRRRLGGTAGRAENDPG